MVQFSSYKCFYTILHLYFNLCCYLSRSHPFRKERPETGLYLWRYICKSILNSYWTIRSLLEYYLFSSIIPIKKLKKIHRPRNYNSEFMYRKMKNSPSPPSKTAIRKLPYSEFIRLGIQSFITFVLKAENFYVGDG